MIDHRLRENPRIKLIRNLVLRTILRRRKLSEETKQVIAMKHSKVYSLNKELSKKNDILGNTSPHSQIRFLNSGSAAGGAGGPSGV